MTQAIIIQEIVEERNRQNSKWGFPQPAMRSPQHALGVLGEEFGEIARAVVEMDCAERVRKSEIDFNLWRKNLRSELIQAAAVCIAWIEQMEHEDEE